MGGNLGFELRVVFNQDLKLLERLVILRLEGCIHLRGSSFQLLEFELNKQVCTVCLRMYSLNLAF